MKIAVIGTGYVGLVSGTCFAAWGHEVVCVDKDAQKIVRLERGIVPIYEPGLDELVERNFAFGRLSFTTNLTEAVKGPSLSSSQSVHRRAPAMAMPIFRLSIWPLANLRR